jgi:hypothetical protein
MGFAGLGSAAGVDSVSGIGYLSSGELRAQRAELRKFGGARVW